MAFALFWICEGARSEKERSAGAIKFTSGDPEGIVGEAMNFLPMIEIWLLMCNFTPTNE